MRFHRNAKLGLARRRELVLAIAGGCSIRAAAATFNVSPSTAHRWWRRWRQAAEDEREKPCPVFSIARADQPVVRVVSLPNRSTRSANAGARLAGTEARRRRHRLRPLDGVEGASSLRSLAAAATGTRAGQPLRVPCPATLLHLDVSLCPLPASGPSRHGRPLTDCRRGRPPGRLRLRARGRRRPLTACLRRGPRRRAHRVPRASSPAHSPSSPSTASRSNG